MTILQRYIFKEWLLTLLAVSVVLYIVLMGVFLGELLNDIADGRVPAGLLGTQLFLATPQILTNLLPLAAFVGVMWGLGRLYRDHEMVVMRSSGFGWRSLLRPLMSLTIPLALLLVLISFVLAPRAAVKSEEVVEQALRSASLWGLQQGRFHIMQSGRLVIYVESMDADGRNMSNVFVRQVDAGRSRVWVARSGEYWVDQDNGKRYLTLRDGEVNELAAGAKNVRVLQFERNDLMLPEPPRGEQKDELETRSFSELILARDAASVAELNWRLSPALAVIILGLLAIPLSHAGPREGRGARAALGILVYAIYANMLHLSKNWVANETLPVGLGMWWVHGVVLLAVLIWLQRQGRMVGSS